MNQYIYTLISVFISAITVVIAFININFYKYTVKEYISMPILIVVSYMVIFSIYPKIATIPIYIIPMIFIYKKSNKIIESLVLGVFIFLVIIIIDNFVGSVILKIMPDRFLASISGNYMTCCFIAIIVYFISKLIGKILIENKSFFVKNYKSKYIILICVILILTFLLFYININWNKSSSPVYLTKVNGIVFISYGFIMAIVCILILFTLRKEEKFKYKQMQLDNLREYTKNLERLYMDMRKFRHDYINIISTMTGFIEEKDIDGLEKHFNEHIYPLNKKINNNNYKLGLLKNIELPELKGLISAKVIRAQEMGLDTTIEVTESIRKVNMDIIDISRCLGILLDNAIEASLESEKKKVNIALINKNNSVIIVIVNSFTGDIPQLCKMFKEGFSTKGKNRGLGLSNLKEIISLYKNVSLDTYIEKNEFVQEITINNK